MRETNTEACDDYPLNKRQTFKLRETNTEACDDYPMNKRQTA